MSLLQRKFLFCGYTLFPNYQFCNHWIATYFKYEQLFDACDHWIFHRGEKAGGIVTFMLINVRISWGKLIGFLLLFFFFFVCYSVEIFLCLIQFFFFFFSLDWKAVAGHLYKFRRQIPGSLWFRFIERPVSTAGGDFCTPQESYQNSNSWFLEFYIC